MYATAIPAGRLTIRAAGDAAEMSCELWLNDDLVGAYPSAAAAAHSVSLHSSGCELIDDAKVRVPESIDGWQWVSVLPRAVADQPVFLMRPSATESVSRA
jgi:hypothetical protein